MIPKRLSQRTGFDWMRQAGDQMWWSKLGEAYGHYEGLINQLIDVVNTKSATT